MIEDYNKANYEPTGVIHHKNAARVLSSLITYFDLHWRSVGSRHIGTTTLKHTIYHTTRNLVTNALHLIILNAVEYCMECRNV